MTDRKQIGKYRVIGEIGQGGMGCVYQAYDAFNDRFVALKVPPEGYWRQQSEAFERVFFNETNAASRLNHPNIIQVYDAGVADRLHYIVMEYVPGGTTLKRFCRPDNLLPLELAGSMLLKCAEALSYAHHQGVIHRDIKPSNVLLKEDRDIKVSDFGLAMLSDPDMVDTQSTILMGSPRYMAPERVREEGITHRSDIYSLGVVMYELLTGIPPFDASHLPALTRQILEADVKPPSVHRRNLSEDIDRIVLKAMARNPDERYASMLEMANDISQAFQDIQLSFSGHQSEQRTELLKQLAFFENFNDSELWELLRWSEWRDVTEGEQIIRDGDLDSAVYMVVQGTVSVEKRGQAIAELGRGELFGEIAFLAQRRRSADVVAVKPTTLLSINIEQVEQASKSCQIQFQKMFIATLIERLVNTTARLAQYSEDK